MRQPERSLAERRVDFKACLERYSQFCRQSYQTIYERFAREFGFDEKVPDADERFLRAFVALEHERAQKLERLRVFDRQRSKAKARGRRTLSKAERENLAAIRNDSSMLRRSKIKLCKKPTKK